MSNILNHIKLIDNKQLKSNNISVHLYSDNLKQHFVLFGFRKEKNILNETDEICIVLCSRSLSDSNLRYVELSTLLVNDIDMYYGDCTVVYDSPYLGMNYKKVKNIFEKNNRLRIT